MKMVFWLFFLEEEITKCSVVYTEECSEFDPLKRSELTPTKSWVA